ncbi:hypothetical protein CDL12_16692 [Handroanthus impetiginosus]|uniref:Uncharacterized protein n=1 Tax=Handroanthus impetiginosus TaxID=429701 RepID=A0A2G9GZM8_9LAMI|nr:hypothetical protein CDL12_16692 [Handroanthus impetiginosus]
MLLITLIKIAIAMTIMKMMATMVHRWLVVYVVKVESFWGVLEGGGDIERQMEGGGRV